MKTTAVLFLALALSACSQVYVKDDGTVASEKDLKECDYEAMKAVGSTDTYFSITRPSGMGNHALIMKKCLELRGYKPKIVQH